MISSLISSDVEEFDIMLQELNRTVRQVELEMNQIKTKMMSRRQVLIKVDDTDQS